MQNKDKETENDHKDEKTRCKTNTGRPQRAL